MEENNIEFNGIEYEAKSLIQFSSLAKLLFDLAKRQKELEIKYNNISNTTGLNKIILDKDQKDAEIDSKGMSDSKNAQKNTDNIDLYSQKSQSIYEKKLIVLEGPKTSSFNNEDKSEVQEEGIDSSSGNKINSDLITKIVKKIKDIEKKISEMSIKTNNDVVPKIRKNQDNILSTNNRLNKLDNNYEEMNKKLMKFVEEFDKIKVKVEDFNIYDIFKGDSGEGGIDAAKALVMNLENKVFKKFGLYDEKIKKNETDFFKAIEEVKNIKGVVDNFKIQNQRTNEKINEIETNLNEYINKNDNKIEEITNSIDNIEQKIKTIFELNLTKNEFDKTIKQIQEDIKNSLNKSLESLKETHHDENNPLLEKKMGEFENSIKEIKKNVNEMNKNFKEKINALESFDNKTKEKISSIEKELIRKVNSTDINTMNDKIYGLEESSRELSTQIDSLLQYNEKFKSEHTHFNKKLEYINGLLSQFQLDMENKKSNPEIQPSSNDTLDLTIFNEYKRENNLKNEKLRMLVDDLSRNINDIGANLHLYLTNKEFSQFQNTFMGLFEEFKTNCFKKFMEKHEIQKNFRILDNQIKSLVDNSKKMDGSDNWLLAKKPLNTYQCASCEATLKDLEKKDNYVAWNKYPNREDKTYRMGHGFSRMLQMVNEEIIKNIENKEGGKGYVSDEDKKYINNYTNKSKYNDSSNMTENKSIKLPKVKQKLMNGDKYGLTVNKFIMNSSPYEDGDLFAQDKPKISKIYKISNSKKYGLTQANMDNVNSMTMGGGERHFTTIKNSNNKDDFLQMSMTQPNEKKQ